MGAAEEKLTKALEQMVDSALKHSERWNAGQKIAATLICLLAGAALITGTDSLRVASGVSIALLGIAFLTFRRKALESQTLVLRDVEGRVRVMINAKGLVFLNPNAQPILWLSADDAGPSVVLDRDRGKSGIYLHLTESYAAARVGGHRGAGVAISSADDGNIGVQLENPSGNSTAILGSIDEFAHLSFFGKEHEKIVAYPDADAIRAYAQKLATRSRPAS